jgi:hypothetical protein
MISLDDFALTGDLQRGELQRIADHYRKHGALHPMVMDHLMRLIDGDAKATFGWRLAMVKHPDIPRLTHGRIERRRAKATLVTILMGHFGANEPGGYDAAVSEVAAHVGLTTARVRQVWDADLKRRRKASTGSDQVV